jgi:hypothetical protein
MKVLGLSDEKLVERLLHRVAVERGCTADVLEDLSEVDARQIFVTEGYTSLSAYCIEALGYSEHEAYPRVSAARLVRRFPYALQMLRDGRVSLSTLRIVGPHLSDENAHERLASAARLTAKKLEVLIASWAPRPDVPTTVTFIAAPEPPRLLQRMEAAATVESMVATIREARSVSAAMGTIPTSIPSQHAASRATEAFEPPAPLPKPLSPGKRCVTFTLDESEYAELMRLRDLDRHTTPDGDIKKIIVRAVRDRLAKVEARKHGTLKRTTPTQVTGGAAAAAGAGVGAAGAGAGAGAGAAAGAGAGAGAGAAAAGAGAGAGARVGAAGAGAGVYAGEPTSRASAAITDKRSPTQQQKRDVAERDGHRCSYVSPSGRRCDATAWLETDHIDGWALTRQTSSDRLQLLCRTHNQAKGSAPQTAGRYYATGDALGARVPRGRFRDRRAIYSLRSERRSQATSARTAQAQLGGATCGSCRRAR